MILKNAKIYSEGLIREGILLINNGIIDQIKFKPGEKDLVKIAKKNQDGKEIDCKYKLILPGIIDIHSHLRDMGQCEKETFSVSIIPHTLKTSTLGHLREGDEVNIEVDLIGKYVEKMLLAEPDEGKGKSGKLNPGFLAEHGFY